MEQRLSLVADFDNKTLSWGDYKITELYFISKWSCIPTDIFNKVRHPKTPKEMAAILKMSPSTFMRVWNAIMYKMWVLPILPYANDFCKKFPYNTAYSYDTYKLGKVYSMLPLLEQTYKDGNRHIAPIVFKTGKSPQELKAVLGKGLWKSLCSNTFSRNKLISNSIDKQKQDLGLYDLNMLPSTLLSLGFGSNPKVVVWAKDYVKPWKDTSAMRRARNIYADTERMASQLNLPFNPKWSYSRMEEAHDEYATKLNKQKYSPDVFPCLSSENIREYEDEGYKASLLLSSKDIIDEGRAMHHCVSRYVDVVRGGRYLVYSVSKEGKKVSTIGINKTPKGYTLNQHYRECNKEVSKEEKILATNLIQALNNKAS